MKKYLTPEVNTIFIMLGRRCNFNCRYCMQLNSSDKLDKLPTEINEDIYDFITDIADNQNNPLYIHFYGGEPLVYIKKIKEIVKHLDHKNIKFSVITNGSLITSKIADYLNEHDFGVAVSWDGYKSIETRKHDVIKENLSNLLKINKLSISAVLSHYAYPMQILEDVQELDNLYREKTGNHLGINIDEIFDCELVDRSLLDVDYNRVRSEITKLTKMTLLYLSNKLKVKDQSDFDSKYYTKVNFILPYINRIRSIIKNKYKLRTNICYCSNGLQVLNLDLEGNLYSCHNCDIKLGNIYSNYYDYLNEVISNDCTSYFYKKMCNNCSVNLLCQGGCKLISESARNETYCKLKRAVFEPIIEGIIEYSKTV